MRSNACALLLLVGPLGLDGCGGSPAGGGAVIDDGGVDLARSDASPVDGAPWTAEAQPELVATDDARVVDDVRAGYPAFVPSMPQVLRGGGRVLDMARIVPVVFSSDDPQVVAQIRDFTTRLPTTDYWHAAVTEYGVGEVTATEPVVLSEAAPATIKDVEINKWLAAHLAQANNADGGAGGAFPPSDGRSIYIIFYPPGTDVISFDGGVSCVDYGAYHDEARLEGGGLTALAVIPRCASYAQLQNLAFLTVATSHELIEAVTDPFLVTQAAFYDVDRAGYAWAFAAGGSEVADLCTLDPTTLYRPAGFDFLVQRTWSNASALAGHDPCVPKLPTDGVYFSAFPTIETLHQVQHHSIAGVVVAPGASKTIDVHLFSDGDTAGPWTLGAVEYQGKRAPRDPENLLSFAWDKTTGSNGDVVHLTITRAVSRLPGPISPLSFSIQSTLGAKTNTWWGVVYE